MLPRSFSREMTLLSLPLLIVVGLIVWGRWKRRLCTPTIALTVQFDAKQSTGKRGTGFVPDERFNFTWVANLKGGPQPGYQFGWNESVVAQTPRGPLVVWQQNKAPAGWRLDAVGGSSVTNLMTNTFASSQSLNRATHSRTYEFSPLALPIDTQSLEWHGEIAAIPSDSTDIWQSPLPHSTLQSWSQTEGSATWRRVVGIPYDTQKLGPVAIRSTVRPDRKHHIEVRVLSRAANRRAFWRLVAIKGGKPRLIWTDKRIQTNAIGYSLGHSSAPSVSGDDFDFDLGKMPADWGQIVFLCDTVFDVSNRALSASSINHIGVTETELAAFQRKTGGYRVSRRLVLRPH